MEIDPSQSETDALKLKSETLASLSNGSISSSVSKLSGSSRALPSGKDFHFYYNFDEFKAPIDEIGAKSQSMLRRINSAKPCWGGKEMEFPQDVEDEGYDWLVNVNDEVIERFDTTLDEFTKARKAEAEKAKAKAKGVMDENGFQLVCGKKKKGATEVVGMKEKEEGVGVRVVERDRKTEGPKQKVPFHISSIRRPQEEYNILVNNSNQPFQHVWLERSEDDLRFIHPLEKQSVHDFVDCNLENLEPMKPPPLESTPFKLVEEVKDLKELVAKLRSVNEFAVDLEHNQYRSFQGLTCLMQISTRTEDFVVDTLKLRIYIGPYLREVFKDPTKKKVMHGADRDIAWLQRDFGIYICNLFDTGQASRVLNMERYSLEHLLQHFCGVTANKQYQNADWRLRPLPREMMRYAREDTHYLLYIYDLMRIRLLSESTDPDNSKVLLEEVYRRSYDLCMQLYEKELLTDTSYLYIYGVQAANLNAQQLSIVAALCEWRDAIARAEDESTGYVLPNKVLLEIAKQMPLTTNKLRHLVKTKHPYVERHLGDVVTIIRHSVQNASCFEAVAQQLKEARIQMASELNNARTDNGEESDSSQQQLTPDSLQLEEKSIKLTGHDPNPKEDNYGNLAKGISQNGSMATETKGRVLPESQREQVVDNPNNSSVGTDMPSGKAAEATVQLLKKPGRAFGALLGSSASKRKIDLKKDEEKLEQIKSSVNLPFYSFSFKEQDSKQAIRQTPGETNRTSNTLLSEDCPRESDLRSKTEDVMVLESDRRVIQAPEESKETFEDPPSEGQPIVSDDIICLDSDSNDEEPADSLDLDKKNVDRNDHQADFEPELVVLDDEDEDEEQISLSDLSSSFQKCLQSTNQNEESKEKDSEESGNLKFKPFDYEVARDGVKFGESSEKERKTGDSDHKNLGKKKSAVTDRSEKDEGLLPQGKRRQAFPASGNRSATFRAP